MKKRGISIRYKILLLLTSIPALTLAVYLLIALRIFTNDKIAYVFDSSNNMTSAVANQIKTQLNSLLSISRPIYQDYLLNNSFSSISNTIFNNEFLFNALIVYKKNTAGIYERQSVLEKSPNLAVELLQPIDGQLGSLFSSLENIKRKVINPFYDDRFYIFDRVDDVATQRSTIFILIARLGDSSEMFTPQQGQRIYLSNEVGKILLGPEEFLGQSISKVLGGGVLEDQKVSKLVKEINGQLVSFSKVGMGDLFVISTVKKEQALNAVDILIKKSLLFFGVLFLTTIIIGIFASNTITSALSDLFSATKKVSEGNFNIHVNVNSNDEVGYLAENFNLMAAEVSRLLTQTAEKARMETELQTAKTVQETLFPEQRARIGSLDISGYYEPASECGGDWWHYCQIGKKIFLWIGDATGHGAPAALITSAAKSASTIIERLNISPSKAMELLNRSIYDVSKGRIMMTFFLAAYDMETGLFSYSSASHEPPFLIKKSETQLNKKNLVPLNDVNNPRLGQSRDTKYDEFSIQLDVGDAVFFYTDGIPEVHAENNSVWGEREFLKALILANKDFPTVELATQQFIKSINNYRKNAPLVDDITFFMVKREEI